MTAESLMKRALKASADCVQNAHTETDGLAALQWADTALILMKLAAEADILTRAQR